MGPTVTRDDEDAHPAAHLLDRVLEVQHAAARRRPLRCGAAVLVLVLGHDHRLCQGCTCMNTKTCATEVIAKASSATHAAEQVCTDASDCHVTTHCGSYATEVATQVDHGSPGEALLIS